MGVSLYYEAERTELLTPIEQAEVARIVDEADAALPASDGEPFLLYARPGDGRVLAGSTKTPTDPDDMEPWLEHQLAALTRIRRAIPNASWRVHVDGADVPWDDDVGYGFR